MGITNPNRGLSGTNTLNGVYLADGNILIGDATNTVQSVVVSGDVTLTNAGVASIKSSVALAGSPTTTTQSASDNSTKIATTAQVQSAIAAAAISGSSYRGFYDASVNLFPSTGGSGTAGAIVAGDYWVVSVAGTLGGEAVSVGTQIYALINTPGQTASNWQTVNGDLVVGAASSTNNAVSLFDGTSGKIIKNSGITASGAGLDNLNAAGATLSGLTASRAVVTDGSKNLASLEYTNSNTVSTLVSRDGSGNFSAGTITAALTGNASTATALQSSRTIGGTSFDGTANIVPQTIQTVDESADTTCFLLFATDSGAQASGQQPKTNTGLTYNPSANALATTTFTGALSGNATTATTLQTARAIYGNNFDGSAALTQVIASTYGGTGNGFTKFSGATTSEKTYTLPDSNATILYSGGALGTPASGALTNCTGLPVAGGGTGVASLTAYAPIFGGTTSTGAVQSGTVGTAGQLLTSNGAGALPTFQAISVPAGSVIQVVNTETGAVATGTTTTPVDDTIPQNTEGDQYLTLAVTPNNTNNKLLIEVNLFASTSASGTTPIIVALFQDSTADAIAATCASTPSAGSLVNITLQYYMTAGTTSSTTFKVRAGGSSAGTMTLNGTAGGRLFGGVAVSSLTITEIKA